MKQYCRYCVHCIEGDVFFCADDARIMSEAEIKRANNCSNFMLTEDIIAGKEYKPRKPREPKAIEDNSEQLKLF